MNERRTPEWTMLRYFPRFIARATLNYSDTPLTVVILSSCIDRSYPTPNSVTTVRRNRICGIRVGRNDFVTATRDNLCLDRSNRIEILELRVSFVF